MQSVSSRIWTRVTVSISYDDNHYTMGTPIETLIVLFAHSKNALCFTVILTIQFNISHLFTLSLNG